MHRLHHHLCQKSSQYQKWHEHPLHHHVHWSVLAAVVVGVAVSLVSLGWSGFEEDYGLPHALAQTAVTIDGNQTFQNIEGFGVEVAGVSWLASDLSNFDSATKDLFFNTLVYDLGLNIIRHVVPYAENLDAAGQSTNDNADPWVTDLSLFDPAKIAYRPDDPAKPGAYDSMVNTDLSALGELKNRGITRFFMTAFSYPKWLVDNTCPGGSYGGNVDPTKLDEAAEYLYGITRSFKERYGMEFEAISLINEPEYCDRYSGADLSQFASLVKQRFSCQGASASSNCVPLSIKIMAPEHSHAETGLTSSGITYSPSQYANDIDIFAYHQYGDADMANRLTAIWNDVSQVYNLPNWEVEMADGSGYHTVADAVLVASDIHNALTLANTNAWLYYSDRTEAPGTYGSEYGLIWMEPPSLHKVTPAAYAMKKYAKFIPAGSVRVGVNGALPAGAYCDTASGQPCVSAYQLPDGGVTIVAINMSSSARSITLSLTGGISASSLNRYELAAPCQLAPEDLSGCDRPAGTVSQGQTITLPATSVTAFTTEIDDGTPPPQPKIGGNQPPNKPVIKHCPGGTCGATSQTLCGNGQIDAGEQCDGASLNNQTCQTLGFTGGTPACYPASSSSACRFDTSGCTGPPSSDTTPPAFTATPQIPNGFTVSSSGSAATVSWNVSDAGGLQQIELYRAPYATGVVVGASTSRSLWQRMWEWFFPPTGAQIQPPACNGTGAGQNMNGCVWAEVTQLRKTFPSVPPFTTTDTATNLSDPTFSSLADGDYWYGIHVIDQAGNIAYEPNPPGPLKVTKGGTPPVACAPGTCRYLDPIFSVQKTKDVIYTEQPVLNPFTGTYETLKLDVCEPKGDTLAQRPVMIYGHGGKFLVGSKSDADAVYFCNEYAKRGYVGISYDYRLATTSAPPQDRGWPAVYDLGAVVRYLRQDVATANRFRIDETKIIVAGFSAGSVVATRVAYVNATLPGDNLSWLGYSNDVSGVFALDSPINGANVESDSIAPLELFLSEDVDPGTIPVSYQCNLPDSADIFLVGPAGPGFAAALATLGVRYDTTCFHAAHTDLVESPYVEQILEESLQFHYPLVVIKATRQNRRYLERRHRFQSERILGFGE